MSAIEGTVHLVFGSRQSNLESYFNYLNCAKVPCESFRTIFGLKHTEIATNLFRIPKLRERSSYARKAYYLQNNPLLDELKAKIKFNLFLNVFDCFVTKFFKNKLKEPVNENNEKIS